MTFAWPLALLGLLLVPLALGGYVLLQRRRMRYAARFTNLDLLSNVVERSPRWRRHLPPALALGAIAALVVGVARPHATISVPREQGTVVLTLDTSGSMEATDVEPNRLAAAREAARTFVDELPEKFRVGVVSFSSVTQTLATPTRDRAVVHGALDSLRANGGTALGDGIGRSLELGRTALAGVERGNEGAPLVILLLSDGANTAGFLEPVEAAGRAAEQRVPVYTVALGTASGEVEVPDRAGGARTIAVPPDPETLAQIAETTGGRFFEAPDAEALSAVYDEIGSRVGSESEERELTALFAAAGTLLLLAGATLSAVWFNRIP